MKKLVAIILAMVMALSICGMSAIAEEVTTDNTAEEELITVEEEVLEGKTEIIAIFNDSKYICIEFTEAVEKDYIHELTSYRTGIFITASTVDNVIFPDGKLLTVDEIEKDNYNECLVFLSTDNGKFFLRLVNEEGYEPEGTLEEIYTVGVSFETVSSNDSSNFMFEGVLYNELTSSQLNSEYFDGVKLYFTMQLPFIEDHNLGLYPMLSGIFFYGPEYCGTEAINYIVSADSTTDTFSVGSPAEGKIVAVILPNQEVILPEETDNPCVYVKDLDQLVGEDLTILFNSYGENFFVKIHIIDHIIDE